LISTGASNGFYALDVPPGGDLSPVRRRLDQWRAIALLDAYETWETLRPGSFGRPKRLGSEILASAAERLHRHERREPCGLAAELTVRRTLGAHHGE
jgi:hypothetical protein